MLHAFDVSFARGGRQVIAEMNLELRADELTVVIGLNGAGKSTLLKLLTGDLKPASGSIWFDGAAAGMDSATIGHPARRALSIHHAGLSLHCS